MVIPSLSLSIYIYIYILWFLRITVQQEQAPIVGGEEPEVCGDKNKDLGDPTSSSQFPDGRIGQ